MNRLFVYGIFLGEYQRQSYGMSNPQYATVLDYATFGHSIVQAEKIAGVGFSLTGLVVDVDPECWRDIDALEGAYKRIKVKTTRGEEVYMYVGGTDEQA